MIQLLALTWMIAIIQLEAIIVQDVHILVIIYIVQVIPWMLGTRKAVTKYSALDIRHMEVDHE